MNFGFDFFETDLNVSRQSLPPVGEVVLCAVEKQFDGGELRTCFQVTRVDLPPSTESTV
jgi:hypothetical protein